MAEPIILLIDIDGTICPQCDGDYEKLLPYSEAITTINRLFDDGYKIIFFTSRFMGRTKGNVEKARDVGYVFTLQQLKTWGVKFHELYMGKPRSDFIIDDRALFFKNDWTEIYKAIQARRVALKK